MVYYSPHELVIDNIFSQFSCTQQGAHVLHTSRLNMAQEPIADGTNHTGTPHSLSSFVYRNKLVKIVETFKRIKSQH